MKLGKTTPLHEFVLGSGFLVLSFIRE